MQRLDQHRRALEKVEDLKQIPLVEIGPGKSDIGNVLVAHLAQSSCFQFQTQRLMESGELVTAFKIHRQQKQIVSLRASRGEDYERRQAILEAFS